MFLFFALRRAESPAQASIDSLIRRVIKLLALWFGENSKQLPLKSWIKRVSGRRSVRAALLLLLVLHAAHASAAHTHLTGVLTVQQADAQPSVSTGGDSQGVGRTENEAQCLLCRLQRNLSATLYNSEPTLTEPRFDFAHAPQINAAPGHSCFSRAPSGRAPPRF